MISKMPEDSLSFLIHMHPPRELTGITGALGSPSTV